MIIAKVVETTRYSMFDLHEFNRDVQRNKRFVKLKESLEKYGWIPGMPMYVVKGNNGKLKIKDGHRRFTAAEELGIPVCYVIVEGLDNGPSVLELQEPTQPWSTLDYLTAYCHQGREDYFEVLNYHKRTGICLGACVSMLGGESAGSQNLGRAFRKGNYRIRDSWHAETVANIVEHMKVCGISWATNNFLVQAISKVVWVEEFDPKVLKHKIKTFPFLLEKQADVSSYLKALEGLYNRQAKEKIPLAFLANEAARKRNPIRR